MSRLIVKGLPKNINEEKLRSSFKDFGAITDVSLKYTKEGVFRRFAFIGFDSEENARKAMKKLNNTFLQASKITVEECKPFGDDLKPRPWSKYARGSSAYKRAHPDDATVAKDLKKPKIETPSKSIEEIDPKFKHFLSVQGIKTVDEESKNEDHLKSLLETINDFKGDYKLSLIFRGLPPSIKQNNFKEWLSPIRVKTMHFYRTSAETFAIVSFIQPPDVRRALQRNDQFLGGFKVQISKFLNSKSPKKEDVDEEPIDIEKEIAKTTEAIMDTGRLFVRNLPYVSNEDDLMFMFKKFGEIADLQCIIDKKSGKCKGFAIVTYVFPENALAAYTALDGSVFKGRMLHILPGDEKPEPKELTIDDQHGLSQFQKEKLVKLKANAGKSHSWNALFLGPNAVADTLAEKLQVEKSDLLSGDAENSAGVRMALAETRLVRETRDFLLSHGVQLDAFSRPAAKRSNTVMILKNLPAHVKEDELRRMFERFGPVKRLIFPPEGGVSALLEMDNKIDAKKAFTSLAYSRLRTQPLYLEWAPIDVFNHSPEDPITSTSAKKLSEDEAIVEDKPVDVKNRELTKEEKRALRKSKKHRTIEDEMELKEEVQQDSLEPESTVAEKMQYTDEEEGTASESDEIEPESAVFVKNLNFDTTDEELYEKFAQLYKVESAVVSKKADPLNPDKMLSMGFGFVQFYKKQDAMDAIKNMQGVLLDGHALELKISNRELADKESVQKKSVSHLEQGNCTKILVRNIPFQASLKEIKQLFSAFGEIKDLRLPKKIGSDQHRGFAFVDFGSKKESKRAFDALVHSTHLYNRRLVLEWAKTEETVDELRTKTSQKYSGHKETKHSKRKIMKALEQGKPLEDENME